LYIADIDKELEKREIGGIELGKGIWSLAYADDMVFLGKISVSRYGHSKKIFKAKEIKTLHRKDKDNGI